MLGNHENAKNCVSQYWEDQKTAKIAFPNIGKTEKQRKLRFPRLGKPSNAKNRVSQSWED